MTSVAPFPFSPRKAVNHQLGIKSSLIPVKELISGTILLSELYVEESSVVYGREPMTGADKKLLPTSEVLSNFLEKFESIASASEINEKRLNSAVEKNPLFSSQIEPLNVALGRIWRLGRISFTDPSFNNSKERTGGLRYQKVLEFSSNLDLLRVLLSNATTEYYAVLLAWFCGDPTPARLKDFEQRLLKFLSILAEEAVFQVKPNEGEVVRFQLTGIYEQILEGNFVSLDSQPEKTGPTRILHQALKQSLFPVLSMDSSGKIQSSLDVKQLRAYTERVGLKSEISTITEFSAPADIDVPKEDTTDQNLFEQEDFQFDLAIPHNTIFYGVPGSGKSHAVNEFISESAETRRIVFHPEYSYNDFVGQIMPQVVDGDVSYSFSPGPFTKILKDAFENPAVAYFLIIEEINRANAAAVFGDIFQLLDRDLSGESAYSLNNELMAEYIFDNPSRRVFVPKNLYFLATMNTSDQNVFTLDTAFQRRWSMHLVENDLEKVPFRHEKILDSGVTWKTFNSTINELIAKDDVSALSSSDKRLGAFFIRPEYLRFIEPSAVENQLQNSLVKRNAVFGETVLKYLWDDAFRFNREIAFNTHIFSTLEEVIHHFNSSEGNTRFEIFSEFLHESLLNAVDEPTAPETSANESAGE